MWAGRPMLCLALSVPYNLVAFCCHVMHQRTLQCKDSNYLVIQSWVDLRVLLIWLAASN